MSNNSYYLLKYNLKNIVIIDTIKQQDNNKFYIINNRLITNDITKINKNYILELTLNNIKDFINLLFLNYDKIDKFFIGICTLDNNIYNLDWNKLFFLNTNFGINKIWNSDYINKKISSMKIIDNSQLNNIKITKNNIHNYFFDTINKLFSTIHDKCINIMNNNIEKYIKKELFKLKKYHFNLDNRFLFNDYYHAMRENSEPLKSKKMIYYTDDIFGYTKQWFEEHNSSKLYKIIFKNDIFTDDLDNTNKNKILKILPYNFLNYLYNVIITPGFRSKLYNNFSGIDINFRKIKLYNFLFDYDIKDQIYQKISISLLNKYIFSSGIPLDYPEGVIWNKENNDIKFKLISSTDVNKIKSNIKKLNYTEYFKNNDNDTNNDYSEFRNYNLNLIKKISKQTRNELNIYLKNLDKL